MDIKFKRIQFFKGEDDKFGMPSDFQSYLIRAREANAGETATSGAGVARVYTLSQSALPLNPDHVVGESGVDDALCEAVKRLKEIHDDEYSIKDFDGE